MIDRPEIRFKLRDHQRAVAHDHSRWRSAVMHRRAGKSILCSGLLTQAATQGQKGDQYAYIGPSYRQTKAIIWGPLQAMARSVGGAKISQAEMAIRFSTGAKVMLLGVESIDSLRGLYLNGLIADEAQLFPKSHWDFVIRPTLADREGWGLVAGTPAGRANLLGWAHYNQTFSHHFYPIGTTDALKQSEIDDLKASSTPQAWAQEFECDFMAAIDGAYYAPQVKALHDRGGLTDVPHDKRFPVVAAIDLGHHDLQPVIFAQEIAGMIRVFHVETYRFTALPDVISHVRKTLEIDVDRWLLPHDAGVRDLTSGLTRQEVFQRAGYDTQIVPNVSLFEGIEQSRQWIEYLLIDETRAGILYEALAGYRADKNEDTGVTKITPLHSWESHYADAFRYLILGDRTVYANWGEQDLSGLVV